VGWWISQPNSVYADPGKILRMFTEGTNPAEFYNSKLGMAWISAENRLTINDVLMGCGQDVMAVRDPGACAAGVDVGRLLHVVIGFKPHEKTFQVCHIASVSSFNDLADLCKRFNVKAAVCDIEPETRQVRQFQADSRFPVWLCDYQEHTSHTGVQWSEDSGIVRVNRTEMLDTVHDYFSSGKVTLPLRCSAVEDYAKELTNVAKVSKEDQVTGSKEFRYVRIGPDHFAHATAYALLSTKRIGTVSTYHENYQHRVKAQIDFDPHTHDQDMGEF